MSLRDLLLHRSGLPPHTWAWVFSSLSRKDFIQHRLPHLSASGKYKEKARYSNIAYAVAGHCIEVLSGEAYEDYISKQIFQPLGMDNSGFLDEQWPRYIFPAFIHDNDHFDPLPPLLRQKGTLHQPCKRSIQQPRRPCSMDGLLTATRTTISL